MRVSVLLLIISFGCSGQSQKKEICYESNLKDCLINFLISVKETSDKKDQSILFLVDLNDKSRNNLFKNGEAALKPSIYTFGLLGPHFNNFLMVYQPNQITIISDYSTEDVLTTLSNFLKSNSEKLNEEQKVELSINTLQILDLRNLNKKLRSEPDIELEH